MRFAGSAVMHVVVAINGLPKPVTFSARLCAAAPR
jgi:hypothetical protein